MNWDTFKLIKFFLGYSRGLVLLSIVTGIIAGASSAVLIMMINARVVGLTTAQPSSFRRFIAFAVVALVTTTISALLATHLAQKTSFQLRLIICRRVLNTPLRQMEEVGQHSVFAALTQDIPTIIGAFTRVSTLVIHIVIVTGCLIYLASLSWEMFLVLISVVIVAVLSYVMPQRIANRYLRQGREEYDTLIRHFRALLKGAKELKLHLHRRSEFFSTLVRPTAEAMRRHNAIGNNIYVLLTSWSQVLYFLIIGFILFGLSDMLHETGTRILTGYALTVLYMSGPIQSIVSTIPTFSTAVISLKKLESLGLSPAASDLDRYETTHPPCSLVWERLELCDITHSYYREREADNFTFGPIGLTIKPGELIFVTGGNGSGKTTFVKLLAGLYIPETGEIRVDGTPVTDENIECYRQYFSVVFTEFHVFEQLLGLTRPELDEQAQSLLTALQLDHKVKVTDGQLSTTDLSYGQRKRLALLTAYLEDRPIYIFDEWAADQDPEFKDIFYRHLLPELKANGKTLVVISHDDKYYHLADRLVRLDYGRVEYDRRLNAESPAATQDGSAEGEVAALSKVAAEGRVPVRAGVGSGVQPYRSFQEYSKLLQTGANGVGDSNGRNRSVEDGFWARARGGDALAEESPRPSKIRLALGLLGYLFVALVVWASVSQLKAPEAVGLSAPAEQFASGRAVQHLRTLAAHPHPTGSAAHAEVRDYIVQTLNALGLRPEIQESTSVRKGRNNFTSAVRVRNVVARLEGTGANRHAVMLAAHYDSAPTSPGASDDGAAVAAMLETARALKSGAPLQNDVIFLFTDAEEIGLLGAKAFVDEHPLAKQVKLVLNFEARGSRGPVFMFETSEHNGWLIREVAKAAPSPFASSLMYDLYKLLPNDTDFTVFREAGLDGLNFAYIGGAQYYHSARDNLQMLDERSLQHHGSYMTALTRHFGNLNLNHAVAAPDAVYFDLFGSRLISYAGGWTLPLVAFAALLYTGLVIAGLRKRLLTMVGLGAGFLAFVLSVLSAAVVVTLLWWGISELGFDAGTRHTNDQYYFLSMLALTLGCSASLYLSLEDRVGVTHLYAGALFGWLALAVAAAVFLPGSSYLFVWPLLAGLAAFACLNFGRRFRISSAWWFVAASLGALPGVLLLSALTYNLHAGLGMAIPSLLVVPVALLLGLLVPYLPYISTPYRWALPVASMVACMVFLFVGCLIPRQSAADPRTNVVNYSLDVDSGEAVWVGDGDARPDEWTSQFFNATAETRALPNHFPYADARFLTSRAQNPGFAPEEIKVLEDRLSGDVRTLRLHVTSPRGARLVYLYLEPEAQVLSATVGGQRLDYGDPAQSRTAKRWEMNYTAIPEEGFDLVLETKQQGPIKGRLVSYSDGLPQLPGQPIKDRPADLMPAPDSDRTRLIKTFELHALSK